MLCHHTWYRPARVEAADVVSQKLHQHVLRRRCRTLRDLEGRDDLWQACGERQTCFRKIPGNWALAGVGDVHSAAQECRRDGGL